MALAFCLYFSPTALPADQHVTFDHLYEGNRWRTEHFILEGQEGCILTYSAGYPTQELLTIVASKRGVFRLTAHFHEVDLLTMQTVYERVMEDDLPTSLTGRYSVMKERGHSILRRGRFNLAIAEATPFVEERLFSVSAQLDANGISGLFEVLLDPRVPSLDFIVANPPNNQTLLEMRPLDFIGDDGDAFFFFEQCERTFVPSFPEKEKSAPLDRNDI